MTKESQEQRFEKLKASLNSLGYVRPGSVVRRFTRCGNPSCQCMVDPPTLHGPYYQWSHKFSNKTISVRLSEAQANLCEAWAEDYKKFKATVRELEHLSLQITDKILEAAEPDQKDISKPKKTRLKSTDKRKSP